MNNYSYQRVTVENIGLLEQLRKVFASTFEEDSIWNSNQPSKEYLARVLRDEKYIALVATSEEGEVVGGLVAYVLQKIDREHSEVYLYDLAVEESHRRQGIATTLISELRTLAKEYGTELIFVQADNEDVEALSLYKKLSVRCETEITHFEISV